MRNQVLIGVSMLVIGVWLAWIIGEKIVAEDVRSMTYGGLALAAFFVAVTILRNWRAGFYLFLFWMMFEDLVRKYMGNDLLLFFGKDVLLALVYVAFFFEIRRRRENMFRPPFLLLLGFFFWLGVLQVFNQNSPDILYGLLGFKVYFFYIPLMFIGYSLVRTDEDLRKFLIVNAVLAGVISVIGIAQAIIGNTFLNPPRLAAELQDLGDLVKSAPLSGELLNLPDSVFVSAGRFSEYLSLSFILVLGTAGYLLLRTKRGRMIVFAVTGLLAAAVLLSGNRGCLMSILATGVILPIGFLWGAPWRWKEGHRIVKVVGRSILVAAMGIFVIFYVFPIDTRSRLAFYSETLLPNSSAYELSHRAWDYPIRNFLAVFDQPNWAIGNGIGTATLGRQYVAKLLRRRVPDIGVEEGFGNLIVEMGVVAPLLWMLWTAALLYHSWKVVRRVKETRFLPIALAIFWYCGLLLYIWTYASLAVYQNYICNAFLWLLVGILFRLPALASEPPGAMTPRTAPLHES